LTPFGHHFRAGVLIFGIFFLKAGDFGDFKKVPQNQANFGLFGRNFIIRFF
jgi:hypothetical protein